MALSEITTEQREKADHLKRNIEKIIGQRTKMSRDRKKRDMAFIMELKSDKNMTPQKRRRMKVEYLLKESNLLRNHRGAKNKISMDDFTIVQIIGKGAFGEVRIVRDKINRKVFAMKTMAKDMMEEKNQVGHMVAERDLMAEADCPWLVKLWYSFQDAKYLYLVMEYCGGGDLMGLLIKEDILPEDSVRFYISELATAINAVHELGFVHRDLKPDNVLIATNGHVRLSDFGLAKSFKSGNDKQIDNWQKYVQTIKPDQDIKSSAEDEDEEDKKGFEKKPKEPKKKRKALYSTVGTPDYIAIEVLYQKGYDKSVDFWSLGVIMYECLCGFAPFHADEPLATCRKIVRYERYFKFTTKMKVSNVAQEFMKLLVCPKHRRLDYQGIQQHLFFKDVNWDKLEETKPPFVPNLKTDDSAEHFDEIEADEIEQEFHEKQEQGFSSFSSVAVEDGNKNNRVFGYTFNAKEAQMFKEMAKETELASEKMKKSKENNKESEKGKAKGKGKGEEKQIKQKLKKKVVK